MTTAIKEQTRKSWAGDRVELFSIDATQFGAPQVYYFTNSVFEDGTAVKFGGKTYTHLAVAMDSLSVSADGKPPQPVFRIATAGGPVASLLQQYNDFKGAKVTRIKTFKLFLDKMWDGSAVVDNPNADPQSILSTETYVIDRKNAANKTGAELQLVAPTDQEGTQLPGRVVKKRYCDAIYRFNNGDGTFEYNGREGFPCPWVGDNPDGSPFFNENDEATAVAAEAAPVSAAPAGPGGQGGHTSIRE